MDEKRRNPSAAQQISLAISGYARSAVYVDITTTLCRRLPYSILSIPNFFKRINAFHRAGIWAKQVDCPKIHHFFKAAQISTNAWQMPNASGRGLPYNHSIPLKNDAKDSVKRAVSVKWRSYYDEGGCTLVYHHEKPEDVVMQLHSDAKRGLSDQQVVSLRSQYGENRLREKKKKTFLQRFFRSV